VVRQVGLAHKAESLISPHAWERSKVRAAEKLVRVFSFPILVCFTEDIEGCFSGGGDFSRSKSIRAIVAKRRERECVATVEKRLKRLPKSPWGPTAMGIKELLPSMISPMTSSAERVRLVNLFVPPFLRANFCFSPSLRRKSDSVY
jgi:hypothetical protein